jgi:gas vesicle protein
MSEQPEPQEEFTSGDLASEFQELGKNLKNVFVNAWESEQRKNLQQELEDGFSELGESLKQTAEEIHDSDTGQRVKAEAEDLRDRVRSGEVETKIREDILAVLHKVNFELGKITQPEPSTGETADDDPGDE